MFFRKHLLTLELPIASWLGAVYKGTLQQGFWAVHLKEYWLVVEAVSHLFSRHSKELVVANKKEYPPKFIFQNKLGDMKYEESTKIFLLLLPPHTCVDGWCVKPSAPPNMELSTGKKSFGARVEDLQTLLLFLVLIFQTSN